MDEQAVGQTLDELRRRLGADRCSLTVFRPAGGSRLIAVEHGHREQRDLSIQPQQLAEHFADGRGAERRTDLAGSAFGSDRSLAAKGYKEVVRTAVRGADGAVIGMLNAIWREESASAGGAAVAVDSAARALARIVSDGEGLA